MIHFDNLSEVLEYIQKNFPDWTVSKTSPKTVLAYDNVKHCANAEFLKVFRPGESNKPFVEFWHNYSTFKEEYIAIMATYMTSIDFAVERIEKENELLGTSPKLLMAIGTFLKSDTQLRKLLRRKLTREDLFCGIGTQKYWGIIPTAFTCAVKQKCEFIIIKKDGEFEMSYKIVSKDNPKEIFVQNSLCVKV